jgi:hypothetical protein
VVQILVYIEGQGYVLQYLDTVPNPPPHPTTPHQSRVQSTLWSLRRDTSESKCMLLLFN